MSHGRRTFNVDGGRYFGRYQIHRTFYVVSRSVYDFGVRCGFVGDFMYEPR